MGLSDLTTRGWTRFAADAGMLAWATAAHAAGLKVLSDPALREKWLQCQGTWFVGVDCLPNDPDGSIDGVPFAGACRMALEPLAVLHRAQLSVTFPGYPRPRAGESEAAFGYRQNRDAAHVDGITAEGPDRRRMITEPHAFILGLPLNRADPDASPLVVWEGSHLVMGRTLRDFVRDHGPDADMTEAYTQARRQCFETCKRLPLVALPGEALLLHRHLLHGIAPWAESAKAPPEGRMMAYFRPLLTGGTTDWLREA